MTRHDTTRHDTCPYCPKFSVSLDTVRNIAVIGGVHDVLNIVSSFSSSKPNIHITAVIEDYIGKNFWTHLFKLNTIGKIKLLISTAKSHRSARHLNAKFLRRAKIYSVASVGQKNLLVGIPKSIFDEADIVFIAGLTDKKRSENRNSDYAAALMRNGVSKDKIYIVPSVAGAAELPLIEGNTLLPVCRNITEVKPELRYMEYHVTDFCNLKCKGCGHLANHVKTLEFAGADTFRFALERLREKFENIQTIRIMGGEPLLCKELHEYINAAHEVFPYSQIKIVTNALLYKNITDLTAEAIRNAGAEIQVSQYPPTREIVPEFAEFCQEHGLKLSVSRPITQFFRRFVSGRDTDFREIWYTCESKDCHFLHGTSFYACPAVWTRTEPKFREIVGDRAFTEGECRGFLYDLEQEIDADGWDILMNIENPMELCRKCGDAKTLFTWESEQGKN